MRTDIKGDLRGHWDWDGRFDPAKRYIYDCANFSVGIFQWIPRSKEPGLKHGNVICRVSGSKYFPERVYGFATYLCQECDKGNLPPDYTYHFE